MYNIIRFRMNGGNEVIKRGLTLEEAQEHCNREDTAGAGWFDGYQLQEPHKIGLLEQTLRMNSIEAGNYFIIEEIKC